MMNEFRDSVTSLTRTDSAIIAGSVGEYCSTI